MVLQDLLNGEEWKKVLKSELDTAYFKGIESFLSSEYSKGKQIFPPKDQIFNIFNIIAPDKVSLYVLSQGQQSRYSNFRPLKLAI